MRRGVPYFDAAEIATRQLHALGVQQVERIPRAVAGTEDEASVLPAWCVQHEVRTLTFVSTADHAGRTRRVLRRALAGQHTELIVRGSAYSGFSPDDWWTTRSGLRTGIIELEKLLLDVVRHPGSP